MERRQHREPTLPDVLLFADVTSLVLIPILAILKRISVDVDQGLVEASVIVACPATGDCPKFLRDILDVYVRYKILLFYAAE